MKKTLAAAALAVAVAVPSVALADLEGFLRSVDAKAKSDVRNFNAMLSAQFGVPVPNVEAIMKTVPRPADAFMVLHVSQQTGMQPDRVLRTYQEHRGKGWGVVAQRMGIKPGSAEFHALKNGNLAFTGEPGRHGKRGKHGDRDDEREHGHGDHGDHGERGDHGGPGMGRGRGH
jgi:hypothetical protein